MFHEDEHSGCEFHYNYSISPNTSLFLMKFPHILQLHVAEITVTYVEWQLTTRIVS